MALLTTDFTFVHIPRAAGRWVREGVQLVYDAKESGSYHGFPMSFYKRPTFCVIRHPADWLRSVYMYHRAHNWQPTTTTSHLWNAFNELLWSAVYAGWGASPAAVDMDLEQLVQRLEYQYPGVITRFWNNYLPAMDIVVPIDRMQEVLPYIAENFISDRPFIGASDTEPELTTSVRKFIEEREPVADLFLGLRELSVNDILVSWHGYVERPITLSLDVDGKPRWGPTGLGSAE